MGRDRSTGGLVQNMSSSEEYLDSLLRAALEQEEIIAKQRAERVHGDTDDNVKTEEDLNLGKSLADSSEFFVGQNDVKDGAIADTVENTEAESEVIPEISVPEPIQENEEPEPEAVPEVEEPEPIVMPVSDDPNHAMSADEIAALFAAADTGVNAEPVSEIEEPDTEPIQENEEPEPIVMPVSDDPNRAMSADEIAALFATADTGANAEPEAEAVQEIEEPNTEPIRENAEPEPEAVPEVEEPEPIVMPVSDDPNRAMSADEIAALFAVADTAANAEPDAEIAEPDTEPIQEKEDLKPEAVPEVEEPEPIVMPVDDDPNRTLSADEIAAMFAAADGSAESAGTLPDDGIEDISNLTDLINAGIAEEKADDIKLPEMDFSEEDLDSMDVEQLLETMAMEDDELAEISDLLKKSDNNELIETEESDSLEQEADLSDEEQISSKKGRKKKKEKKKKDKKEKKSLFSIFKKKEKTQESREENILSEDIPEQVNLESAEHIGAESQTDDTSATEAADLLEADQNDIIDLMSQFGEGEDLEALFGGENEPIQADIQTLDLSEEEQQELSEIRDITPKEDSNTKKKGFWGKLFDMLTEEVEEEEEIKEKPKSKKGKKDKKDKKAPNGENEELINELEAEDDLEEKGKKKGKKKDKKEKKPKKPKKEKITEEPAGNEKKLPIKMVIRIFVLCISVLLLLVIGSNVLVNFSTLNSARNAYNEGNYTAAYQNLIGKKLSASDQSILDKTTLILKVQRKYDSYRNYMSLGNREYACNALLEGYAAYKDSYETAQQYNIVDEIDTIKRVIVDALQNTFGISEEKADELNAIDDPAQYQERVRRVITTQPAQTDLSENQSQREAMEGMPDILDEEQQIIHQIDE